MCINVVNIKKKKQSLLGWCSELAHESYQVGRPAMGLVASTLYLYKNENANLFYALYFAFFMQLSANAGNDYMDWERDQAEEGREFSCSRGKAKSKERVWWYWMIGSTIGTTVFLLTDIKRAFIYIVVFEFMGHLLYNGCFYGFAVHDLSLVKSHGFPLDVVVAAYSYMPFPHLITARSWLPTLTVSMWGLTMIWAQLKDYDHEKNTKVNTTATVLGPTLTKLIISGAAVIMMYTDPKLSIYGIYTCYACYAFPKKVGKMSVMMGLNLFLVVCLDEKVDPIVKFTTFGIQFLAGVWHYVLPRLNVVL